MTLLELLCTLLCELWWTSRPAQLLLLCGTVIVVALFLALLLAGGVRGSAGTSVVSASRTAPVGPAAWHAAVVGSHSSDSDIPCSENT